MFRPRVIPVLLLKGLGLVKTTRFKDPTYIGDPMNAIKIFNDLEADELIFLDITATKEKRLPDLKLIQRISSEAFMPISIGGGIKTLDDAKKIIDSGSEKIVINSACFYEPDLIEKVAVLFGSQSVSVSIDVNTNIWGVQKVYINCGKTNTNYNPVEYAKKIESFGAGEIIVNSIEKDGTMNGYDIKLISSMTNAIKIPVVALGGAGNLEHLKNAYINGNAHAMAAGSMFVFHGPRRGVLINYPTKEELKKIYSSV